MLDLIGKKINMLTILGKDPERKGYVICQCDCGNIISARPTRIKSGSTSSCGCNKKKRQRSSLVGNRYGKLLVESLVPGTDKGNTSLTRYVCLCDCGNRVEIGYEALKKGKTSCGCDFLKPANDLTDKRFGKLTVVSRIVELNQYYFAMKWKCRCDCGNETTATTLELQAATVTSCGCTAAEDITLDLANINRGNIEKTNVLSLQGALDGVMYENNVSGVRGVYYSNTYSNYWAVIMFKGKKYNLGSYKNIEDAKKARKKAEQILYGEFLDYYDTELKPEIDAQNEKNERDQMNEFIENTQSIQENAQRTPFVVPGKYAEGLCQVCGKPVPAGRSKYCSNLCGRKALQEIHYQKRKSEDRFCEVCGKILPSNRTKYCSDSCAGLAVNVKRKTISKRTGKAQQKEIVCPDCGKTAWVSYKSVRCKECQAEARKLQNLESHQRGIEGKTRKIGSTAICEKCGKEYIVRGASQKYCVSCSALAAAENAREGQQKRRKPVEETEITCRICGKVFTSTAGKKPVYCSEECRIAGMKAYNKQKWAEKKAQDE